jgi:hypothetical protein
LAESRRYLHSYRNQERVRRIRGGRRVRSRRRDGPPLSHGCNARDRSPLRCRQVRRRRRSQKSDTHRARVLVGGRTRGGVRFIGALRLAVQRRRTAVPRWRLGRFPNRVRLVRLHQLLLLIVLVEEHGQIGSRPLLIILAHVGIFVHTLRIERGGLIAHYNRMGEGARRWDEGSALERGETRGRGRDRSRRKRRAADSDAAVRLLLLLWCACWMVVDLDGLRHQET